MKRIAVIAMVLSFFTSIVFAKDHADQYQAGTFSSTGRLSDGSYANCSGGGCRVYSAGHNIHYIMTKDGVYSIEAPVSMAGTILLILFNAFLH